MKNNRMNLILNLIIAFSIGFALSTFFYYSGYSIEKPFSFSITGNVSAPGNWIGENQIRTENGKVIIELENASISRYAPTGSMIPTLNENSNGIRIKPESAERISVGDIITFSEGNDLIVHRVVEKGRDKDGEWFITKGDNSGVSDGKVYFKDVKFVTIGILY